MFWSMCWESGPGSGNGTPTGNKWGRPGQFPAPATDNVFRAPSAWKLHLSRGTIMKNYVSETTQFIQDFLKKHPEVVDKQREARATWWDRPQNFKDRKRLEAAEVPMKS